MTTIGGKLDTVVFPDVVRLSFPQVVHHLADILGYKLVAYLGSVKETRAVQQWADDARAPSSETVQRLRFALQVAELLRRSDGAEITQAWFQGLNPLLDDCSPARLVREEPIDEIGPQVLDAARAFIGA